MYVLVHHTVTNPQRFWAAAESAIPDTPPSIKLHQSLVARDGKKATCLWEADSVDAVRSYLEPLVGDISRNEYSEAENREGIAMPSGVKQEVAG